jgi:hypothetical protein
VPYVRKRNRFFASAPLWNLTAQHLQRTPRRARTGTPWSPVSVVIGRFNRAPLLRPATHHLRKQQFLPTIAIAEVLEDVAQPVHLAALHSAVSPKVARTAFRRTFEPSRMTSRLRSVQRPRLCRLARRSWQTRAFSVEPSLAPRREHDREPLYCPVAALLQPRLVPWSRTRALMRPAGFPRRTSVSAAGTSAAIGCDRASRWTFRGTRLVRPLRTGTSTTSATRLRAGTKRSRPSTARRVEA